MAQNLTLLLTIRTIAQQGEKILGNRWLPFIDYLRNELRGHGTESDLSSDDLIVFTFPQGLTAFAVLLKAIVNSKKEHGWHSSNGPCPLQIVMDIVPPGAPEIADLLPDNNSWDSLHQEVLYAQISPPLFDIRHWR